MFLCGLPIKEKQNPFFPACRLPYRCRSTCLCPSTKLTSSMRQPDTYHLPSMSSLSRPLRMGKPVVSMGAGQGGAVGAAAVAS